MKKSFVLIAAILAMGVLAGCSNDAGTVEEATDKSSYETTKGKKGAMESDAGLKAPSSSPNVGGG
jgi:uncharacterized lipoprotein